MMAQNSKVALVTGASKGIGLAIAKLFAEHGMTVFLSARSDSLLQVATKAMREDGLDVYALPFDVSDPKQMQHSIAHIKKQTGRLDILVNNAGVIDPISRIEDSDVDAWSRVIDINTKGVFYGIRFAAPIMKAQKSGTIINISSGAATGALEGWSHYCASKAAALSLTKCADKELRRFGVKVVGLSPGTVATDMQAAIKESGVNPVSQLDWSRHIPTDYVAKAALALTGDMADDWLGQDFSLKTNEGRAAVGLPPLS